VLALVIDDSRAMRMILKRTLVDLGYEVVEAALKPFSAEAITDKLRLLGLLPAAVPSGSAT
jgi:CheY-like chemotaxis protein